MSIQPFKVALEQKILDDLRVRLAMTRWTDEVSGAGWDYGTDLSYLRELVQYWQSKFNWRAQEETINRFAHFRTEVDGFCLHFIHERGKGVKPLPILLTHGFPDSFLRMSKIIPLLTEEKNGMSFDVIVPSLPGYGFSDRPTEKGMNPQKIANLLSRLMTNKLGYQKFAAHGGDWGSTITEQLALDYPDALVGIHLTDIPWWHLFTVPPGDLSEGERKYLEAGKKWSMTAGGYAAIQSTRPQTLAYGLSDSPTGLAAWIVDLFRSWSDCDGDVEKRFSKDELLTNITLYWATGTINSAMRLYYETQRTPPQNAKKRVETPTGAAMFPKDLIPAPREYAERFFSIRRWTEMPRGGHFAALEEPDLLAADIRAFFKSL